MKKFKKSILQLIIATILFNLVKLSEFLMQQDGEVYFISGVIIGVLSLTSIFLLILCIMDHINTMLFKK